MARSGMDQDQLRTIFDQQAARYDQQWARMAAIPACLHYLLESMLVELPEEAHILCVGAGTGKEILYLASRRPGWRFTAVDPSAAMVEVCQQAVSAAGYSERCRVHTGYTEDLPGVPAFEAATSLLVSQFLLEASQRRAFFQTIATRLKPGGVLINADLAADTGSHDYTVLLQAWMTLMSEADLSPEDRERIRAAYGRDVAILPSGQIATLIASAGFEPPVQFFQAGLMHAWCGTKLSR